MTVIEIILEHYNSQLDALEIKKIHGVEFQVDIDTYNAARNEVQEMLRYHLKNNGEYSNVLLHQLTRHRMQIGEVFGEALEYYRATDILHAMEAIELNKIEGNMFRLPPLKSLYKIHHNPMSGFGYSLLLNIKNYWFDKQEHIRKDKRRNYATILEKVPEGNIAHVMNYMHMEAVHSKKLTGEWLVYAKHNYKNYFLCLATHNEGDQNIFDNKILSCYKEFPEIVSL